MKKNWIILHAAVAILSLFMLTSCYDKLAEAFSMKPLYLNASVEEPRAATRAATNIQSSWFDKDELIAVYINEAGNPSARVEDGNGTVHYPAIYTTSSPNEATRMNVLTFSPQLYFPIGNGDTKPNVDIRAYYPSTVTNTQTVFAVDKDQTGADGDEKYKKSDLMFAKIDNQGRTSGSINLNFSHKMVKFLFNVVPDGDVTINDCYLVGVQTAIGFNPETGEVTTLSENASNRRDVKLDNGGAVIIPPQTLTGEFIAVRGTARKDGQPDKIDKLAKFSLKETGAGGALTTRTLESGKCYTVNLSVGYDNFDYTYSIGDWDEAAGVISVSALGTDGFCIDNTTIYSDNDYTHGDDNYSYTGEAINIKPVIKYGTKVLARGTDYDLRYFDNVHAGKATVLAIGKGAYEGYAVAGSFTISQIASSLRFTKADKTTALENNKLSKVYAYNYNINPMPGESVTPKDLYLDKVGNGTMEFVVGRVSGDTTTDPAKVAIVNSSTGVITLKGKGKVKVTARMKADKDYLASETSFTLEVTAADASESSGKLRAYFTDYGWNDTKNERIKPSLVYTGSAQKPTVTVQAYDETDGVWGEISSGSGYFNVTYDTNTTDVRSDVKAYVNFNDAGPYAGQIPMEYAITKANPTISMFEASTLIASKKAGEAETVTNDKTLCLALPHRIYNTSNIATDLTRVRTLTTDFGTVTIEPKNNATNNICSITAGTAVTNNGYSQNFTFSALAKSTHKTLISKSGDIWENGIYETGSGDELVFTAKVPEGDNWNEVSIDFTVKAVQSEYAYFYTGKTQVFECPATGEYVLEVWGAQGGFADDRFNQSLTEHTTFAGGSGAHVGGKILLTAGEKLYVNVGQAGITVDFDHHHPSTSASTFGYSNRFSAYADGNYNKGNVSAPSAPRGFQRDASTYSSSKVIPLGTAWNGGGGQVWGLQHWNTEDAWQVKYSLAGGGGGTDISLDWKGADTDWKNPEHMLTRIIVAGGGGGAIYYSATAGTGNSAGADAGYGEISATGLKGKDGVYDSSTFPDSGKGGELKKGGSCGVAGGVDTYGHDNRYSKFYDGRPFCFSGADGIFGEGGYYACPEEGSGCGGGGWYGGGAASQHAGNGTGGGGSSYVWCSSLEDCYPTYASLHNATNTADVASNFYYYRYTSHSGTIQTPKDRSYRYISEGYSDKSGLSSEISGEMADGRAKITCVKTSNTVSHGNRN